MVNRTMRPTQVLSLVRRSARQRRMTVGELPGRGKGSHRLYALIDANGHEVARFGLTDHPKDLSWPLLRRIEDGLAPWFGEKWMEKR
jgi:hypothetical protein